MSKTRGTGCTFRRKNSPNWYFAYVASNGRQIQQSSGSPIRAVAERLLRRKLEEVAKGMPVEQSTNLRYEGIRDSLLTEYRNNHVGLIEKRGGKIHGLDYLDEFFQKMKVVNITSPKLREFVSKLQSGELQKKCRSPKEKRAIRSMKNATINRILALLRRMMNLARKDGLIHYVPAFPMLKEDNVRTGFVETERFKELLRQLPEHLHPLMVFLFTTGCRIGAALQITWDMLSADARFLTLPPMFVKNKKPITLKLSDDLTAVLKKMFRQVGKPIFDGTNLRRAWAAATREAGCPGLLVHDLRRSGARNLREAGVEETVIMKIGGWLTRSVFIRYGIVATKDIEIAMKKLGRRNGILIEVANSAK
jgi:integrase